jgi:hypothetical protein
LKCFKSVLNSFEFETNSNATIGYYSLWAHPSVTPPPYLDCHPPPSRARLYRCRDPPSAAPQAAPDQPPLSSSTRRHLPDPPPLHCLPRRAPLKGRRFHPCPPFPAPPPPLWPRREYLPPSLCPLVQRRPSGSRRRAGLEVTTVETFSCSVNRVAPWAMNPIRRAPHLPLPSPMLQDPTATDGSRRSTATAVERRRPSLPSLPHRRQTSSVSPHPLQLARWSALASPVLPSPPLLHLDVRVASGSHVAPDCATTGGGQAAAFPVGSGRRCQTVGRCRPIDYSAFLNF